MSDDLVQQVAKLLAESEGHTWRPWFAEQYGEYYRIQARAIIPLVVAHERAKVVAIVKQYRDGADRYHADTGGGYCCLKTAANILEAVASGAHMETNNAD